MKKVLPAPSCPMGYTDGDLDAILGPLRDDFGHWMRGQTCSVCEGRRYNYEKKEYEPTECADTPHGVVTYGHDLRHFLAYPPGKAPIYD